MKGISSYNFPMYKKVWDIANGRDKYMNFPLASTVAMPLKSSRNMCIKRCIAAEVITELGHSLHL
jgi:hypothetical protein